MRKKLLYIVGFSCLSAAAFSQRHELGLQLGMSNLVGDIGRTGYVLQKPFGEIKKFGIPFYGGLLYRMNFNPYQTLRFNLGWNHLEFDDLHAVEQYRYNRGFRSTNDAFEADALFEYNFLPINNEQKEGLVSPYIFGGVGAILADARRVTADFNNPASTTTSYAKKLTMALPFGAGLKYKFKYNWTVFAEFMFRPTFSDNIDYSGITKNDVRLLNKKGQNADLIKQVTDEVVRDNSFGNTNSKDWINSATLGISYSFGRPPCYCEKN